MTGVNGVAVARSKEKVWLQVGSFSILQEVAVVEGLAEELILRLDLGEAFDELLLNHILDFKQEQTKENCKKSSIREHKEVLRDRRVVHNSEDHKEKDKSKLKETGNEVEEVKITRNQKKREDDQWIQIQNLEKEGVSVLNPDDLEEMKEEVAEKSEEETEIGEKEFLNGIDTCDDEDVNLQAITGTSDFTIPTCQRCNCRNLAR